MNTAHEYSFDLLRAASFFLQVIILYFNNLKGDFSKNLSCYNKGTITLITQGWSAHQITPHRREVLPMTVAEALTLMISFGALIVAIMSDKNQKK
jgi:hypothetical protein